MQHTFVRADFRHGMVGVQHKIHMLSIHLVSNILPSEHLSIAVYPFIIGHKPGVCVVPDVMRIWSPAPASVLLLLSPLLAAMPALKQYLQQWQHQQQQLVQATCSGAANTLSSPIKIIGFHASMYLGYV
eukprot:scaffold275371_cov22-Tisochrysis_lutea.AAC.1